MSYKNTCSGSNLSIKIIHLVAWCVVEYTKTQLLFVFPLQCFAFSLSMKPCICAYFIIENGNKTKQCDDKTWYLYNITAIIAKPSVRKSPDTYYLA